MAATTKRSPYYTSYKASKQVRNFGLITLVTLFACIMLAAYLLPFAYMTLTSLKDKDQIVASATGSVLPLSPITIDYEGKNYEVFKVPLEDGSVRELALYKPGRQESTFIDPENLDAEPILWQGRWRTLEKSMEFAPRTGNYQEAWELADFPQLIFNTAFIALTGVIGTLLSCICVAYAFARFPLPAKRLLFLVLISTIILPKQVMLVPTFAFFDRIGWTGTWLPLIVPHFFANAYNVFLLRQYFLGLPRELDEAAMIDGAGPLRILLYIIIPQSWPVIVAVGLFHLVFAWNDYFEPLIYTLGKPELQPISVGIQQFNFRYDQQPHLIQSTALLGMAVPVLLFFLAQRFFMRGVVVTGVDK
ncbi:MAG: carbohydrate ABC transporter permease [Anaerolineae bacterium]|nr:carbohydrate ABC transporter permease [Anaerolineae bacterium]